MERPLDTFERRELIVELLVNTFVSVRPDAVRSIARSAFNWTYLSDQWLLKELLKDEIGADV
jgi:hypothetical protein